MTMHCLCVELSDDQYEYVKTLADHKTLSMSQLVAQFVQEAIDTHVDMRVTLRTRYLENEEPCR